MTDAKAFIGWLDQQSSVAKNRKIGTQGYCMGGAMAFRTASAVPDRVGAVASFHGGGLVTDTPDSPHLQAAKTKAQFLIAIAQTTICGLPPKRPCEGYVRQGGPARGDRSVPGPCTAGVRRIRASTASRRPRRHGAVCWRCTARLSRRAQRRTKGFASISIRGLRPADSPPRASRAASTARYPLARLARTARSHLGVSAGL